MTLPDAAIASRLADSLPSARWFAEKATRIRAVEIVDRIGLEDDARDGGRGTELFLTLADVRSGAARSASRYAVVLDADGRDVAATPEVAIRLVRLVLAARSLPGRTGRLVGHVVGAAPAGDAAWPLTASPLGGDASNTSFVVRGGTAGWVVKLLRRSRAGIQPEVEIGRFLADAAPWPETPRLCGWLDYEATGGDATTLATVHEYAPDRAPAWDVLVGLLTEHAVATGGEDVEPILPIVDALGGTTARMHRALASRPDVPAFAPAPATVAGRRAMAEHMADHARHVAATIESRLDRLPAGIAGRLGRVLSAWPALVARFASFPAISLAAADIRVHGDYHLGQVLVPAEAADTPPSGTVGGIMVIDFEGEPGRSLEERRARTSAAKDVAGMCRSFDYLLRHVAATTGRTYAPAALERVEARYLAAYDGVAAGAAWWPADRDEAASLLAIFRLDKAIYELAYELGHRPDWIEVPLAAVEAAMAAPGPE